MRQTRCGLHKVVMKLMYVALLIHLNMCVLASASFNDILGELDIIHSV